MVNTNGDKVGKIEDVVLDQTAIFRGGFSRQLLGISDKDVACH